VFVRADQVVRNTENMLVLRCGFVVVFLCIVHRDSVVVLCSLRLKNIMLNGDGHAKETPSDYSALR
jgi:hypothetical protein